MAIVQRWYDRACNDLHIHYDTPALQQFMADEWVKVNGGKDWWYNIAHIPVTPEMLVRLQEAVDTKSLNHNTRIDEWGWHRDDHYEDIQQAIDAVCTYMGISISANKGKGKSKIKYANKYKRIKEVTYWCWWD